MRVTIDGTEYVPVTAKRITVDGVVYAALPLPMPGQGPPFPGKPLKIIDDDGDAWLPSNNREGYYRCRRDERASGFDLAEQTRESIRQFWGIAREEY